MAKPGGDETRVLPDGIGIEEIAYMDTREREYETLRGMTPAAKLAVMKTLIRQAYELKAAGIRATQPGLSEEEVWTRTRALVGRDRS